MFASRASTLLLAFSGLVALLAPARASAQHRSLGLLVTEEGSPLYRLGLTPVAESADPVARGHVQLELWSGYSNIFEQDSTRSHVLFLDLERLINTVTVRVGAARGLEVGARLGLETSWGGFLDGFLSGFHETVGFGNANRERFPNGVYRQELDDGDGKVLLDVPQRTFHPVDVRIFGKWRFLGSAGDRRVASLRVVGRLPVSSNLAGEERADVGVMAATRLSSGPWHVHSTVGVLTSFAAPSPDAILRQRAFLFLVGLERNLGARWSGVVEFNAQTPRVRSFDGTELDGLPGDFVFGVVGLLGRHWKVDVSFQEDIPPGSPAVDFTAGLRISRIW